MKNYYKLFFVFFVVIFLIVSCSKKQSKMPDNSNKKNTPVAQKQQPYMIKVLQVKDKTKRTSLLNGQKLYYTYCSDCHGIQGKGDGNKGLGLNPRPKDETNYKIMKNLDDWYLFKITKEGGISVKKSAFMPAYKNKLKDKEIKDIVKFIKLFSAKN